MLRIFISLNFAENCRLLFRVSELGYFCILFMALYGGFFVFIERFYSYAEPYVLLLSLLLLYVRTGNNKVYDHHYYQKLNKITAFL